MTGDEEPAHERQPPVARSEDKSGCLFNVLPYAAAGIAAALGASAETVFWVLLVGLIPMLFFLAGAILLSIHALFEEIGWVWLIVGLVALFLIGSQFRRDCSDVIDGGRYGEVSICVP